MIMAKPLWQDLLLPPGNEDRLWELFHENSKNGRYNHCPDPEEVRTRVDKLQASLLYEGYPIVELPQAISPSVSLIDAIESRHSVRQYMADSLSLEQISTLLHYAYGVTRDNTGTPKPRSLRVVPSGGALYPLELYLHSACITGLQPGLYHFNPVENHLRHLITGDLSREISEALIQPEIGLGASAIVFLTAVFDRSIFKYGDRGYRFVLLEAGHVAQNFNLVAAGLGLGSLNIGGFFDREIDRWLGLDGITHSIVYIVAFGHPSVSNAPSTIHPI
jgi:SagB-type dehydrogenase family enzyme